MYYFLFFIFVAGGISMLFNSGGGGIPSMKTDISIPLFVFLAFLFVLSIVLYYIQSSPSTFSYMYFLIFLVLITVGVFVSNQFSQGIEKVNLIDSICFIGFVLVFTLVGLHIDYFYKNWQMNYLLYAFIFVTGLTLFYNTLKTITIPVDTNFILQFIFYIPCLITEFAQYVVEDYYTTPNFIFFLFVIEIFLVLLYLYIPKWMTLSSRMNRIGIFEKSAFLDKEQILGNSDSFEIEKPQKSTTQLFNNLPDLTINRNYGLTMWLYISPSEREAEVFNYANHPQITYLPKSRDTGKLKIRFSDSVFYEFSFPLQKWNFIGINYNDNGICDVFLNAELLHSIDLAKDLPTYSNSDVISIGSDGGVYGSISNISYYKNPLTLSKIQTTYHLLMYRNPPEY